MTDLYGVIKKVTSNGLMIAVDGLFWGGLDYWRLYDISNIKNGWKQITIFENLYEEGMIIKITGNIIECVLYVDEIGYCLHKTFESTKNGLIDLHAHDEHNLNCYEKMDLI